MIIRQWLQRIAKYLRSIPNKYYIYGGAGLAVVFYGLNFLIPKQVAFSYAGQTCHKQLTLLPGLQAVQDDAYKVSFSQDWKIGTVPIMSLKTCFATKNAPVTGSRVVGVAPFNGPLARTMYRITVAEAPSAMLQSIKAEIPVSKQLKIELSQADNVNDYSLRVEDKSVPCSATGISVSCDMPSLNLEQGRSYEYSLERSFQASKAVSIGNGSFKTLKAIAVTQASVSSDQVVFARPTSLSFTTDKPMVAASVTLTSEGKPVEFTGKASGTSYTLTLKAELPREKPYELIVKTIDAKDGSSLVEPYKVTFRTSGGPKVAAVSVGSTGVGQSAGIVLTFDQALSKTKDVMPFFSFAGGQASIQKLSDTQVRVQLASLPLCQPFTISIKQGLPSEFDIVSTQAWAFTGRTTCYQTSTYGTSIRGRALNAYIFGTSGPVTMYVGGIHGSEPSSTSLMRAWMTELEANPNRYAGKRIVVVPAINPDGLAAGSRTNARGVNLNRNFPTDNWSKSIKDTDGTHPTGGGESALSEPEASSLARLTTSYSPRLLLSFHAVGSLVIGDPGGYSASYASRYAGMVGYRDATNNGAGSFDYNISGAYEDWTFRNVGIPSIVVELSSYSSVNYAGHYKALWAMLD